MTKSSRNSAFEVLRLLAMFMIVFEHAMLVTSLHTDDVLSPLDNISWLIEAFTVCAVDLFFLLTGYFVSGRDIKASKIARLWVKIIIYSLGGYIIAVLAGIDVFSIKSFITFACPIFSRKYWFMQTYIVLLLIAPYVVKMLEQLSLKKYLTLIGILLVFFSLHETFIPVSRTLDTTQGYGIIWALVLLTVGNFLKKFGKEFLEKVPTLAYLGGYIVIGLCIFVSNYLIVKFDIMQGVSSRTNFYAYNSITVFAQSVCLFCFFIRLSEHEWHNRIINIMGSSAIAVYLLGSHSEFMSYAWTDIFKIDRYLDNLGAYFGLSAVFSVLIVLLCIAVDIVLESAYGFIRRKL